jgi:hypothetical protein
MPVFSAVPGNRITTYVIGFAVQLLVGDRQPPERKAWPELRAGATVCDAHTFLRMNSHSLLCFCISILYKDSFAGRYNVSLLPTNWLPQNQRLLIATTICVALAATAHTTEGSAVGRQGDKGLSCSSAACEIYPFRQKPEIV